MTPEIDTRHGTAGRGEYGARSPRRAALRPRPAVPSLSPLHPDLVFGLQLEGRVIQTSDPNFDVRVGVGGVKEPRPTAGTEAATVKA